MGDGATAGVVVTGVGPVRPGLPDDEEEGEGETAGACAAPAGEGLGSAVGSGSAGGAYTATEDGGRPAYGGTPEPGRRPLPDPAADP